MLAIHALNLEYRTDRWARCKEIEATTPGIRFERVNGLLYPPGRRWLGCTRSHQEAVFEARLRGDPWVIVAEDDIEFAPDFDADRFAELIDWADGREFGAVYGGTVSWCGTDTAKALHRFEPRVVVETDFYLSAHLVVYYARAYEAVLRWPYGFCADYNPTTVATSMEWHLEPTHAIKRGLVVPFLAVQRSDFSDNCDRVLDLDETWKRAEQTWKNVCRV